MKKVAIVTGAGSGIGRASALALAQGRLPRRARRPPRRRARGDAAPPPATRADRVLAVPTDVTDPAAVKALFAAVKDKLRPARPAVQQRRHRRAAGAARGADVEQWQAVVDINLTAVFLCTQQAFRLMKAQTPRGGRIINNGSISAHAPRPFSSPYTATKHAITGLTKATSLDGRAVRHRLRPDRHRQRRHRDDRSA